MTGGALEDLVVLDVADGIAGHFATRLMADAGASVTMVEPAIGAWVRSQPPFAAATGTPGESLLHRHLNSGKRSQVADLADGAARRWLHRRAAEADIVVVADAELAHDLRTSSERPVIGLVTEFATSGPYSGWLGGELILQALSGSMYVSGHPDRPPLYGVGHRASMAAGLWLYVGCLSALHALRSGSAGPRLVEVAAHEAAAAMEQNLTTQWHYSGTISRRGEAERARARGRVRCADGWVIFMVRDGQWADACEVFGAHDLAEDPRFDRYGAMVRNWPVANALLEEHAQRRTAASLLEEAMRVGLVLAPVCSPTMLRDDHHLGVRGFWEETVPDGAPSLGPLFRMGRNVTRRDRPAPDMGPPAGGLIEPSTPSVADRGERSASRGCRPLEGISVLDITTAWAGPMATRILAHLGAEVLKLEGPDRPDDWRGVREQGAVLEWYPECHPGERPFDRHAWYNSQNHDKRSIVLDLKERRGVELARELAIRADVIVTNFSPGTLDRWGLGHATVSRANDRVVVVEMSAAGRGGPRSGQRGLGPTMEAMAGITFGIGYPDTGPIGSGTAYLDPAGALHGAAAVVTALVARDTSGRGQPIDLSQQEAAMHWVGELLLEGIDAGQGPELLGNRDRVACPHGAYPASGDDEWVAIATYTEAQWGALRTVLRADSVEVPVAWDDREARRRDEDGLDDMLRRWTASQHKAAVAARLQAAGVPAAPVCSARDLSEDPQLGAVGWFTTLDHPVAGTHRYPGLPLRFDGVRNRPERPSPCFGQHTDAVLRDLLGVGADELHALRLGGVVTSVPRSSGIKLRRPGRR